MIRSGLRIFGRLRSMGRDELVKMVCLSGVFALAIASYTVLKELKDIVFVATVGTDWVPWAKSISIFALIPFVLLYSHLVNRLRRHQILCLCALVYGVLGLLFAYLLGDPTHGLVNTVASPTRVLGWIFYIFIEGASPFIVGVTWAFTNSVFDPQEAREGYSFLTACSKIGGILAAGSSWYLLAHCVSISGIAKQQLLIALPSLVLLFIPLVVITLVKKVSSKHLHGYEAAYEYQKEEAKQHKKPGIFSGLWLFVKQPYVLGVFSMVFFYEIIDSVLSYLRLVYAGGDGAGLEEFGAKLFIIALSYHVVGFFIALLGTTALLHWLGERRCLILVPILIGILLFSFLAFGTFTAFMVAFIGMRAINYSFLYPVRESLYIPTVKAIKFQSKAWIDAFGKRFAKFTGSQFNILTRWILHTGGFGLFQIMHGAFFACMIGTWMVAAFFMGRRYSRAIKTNEVIGADQDVA